MPASAPQHYLFALTDGGGTVPPEIGVVRRLVDRGHRVRVLAETSMEQSVRAVGAEFVPWQPGPAAHGAPPGAAAYRDGETRDPWTLARGMADHMIAGPALGQARRLRSVAAVQRPDLVVTSFVAFGAMAAADAAELSFDVLIPNIYPIPAAGLPPMGTGWKPARTGLGRLRDRVVGRASTAMLGRFALPRLNEVRAELGTPPLRVLWDQVHRARRQFLLTSRSFDFPGELPSSVRYAGPVLDDPVWARADEWREPGGRGPLVLVALSSTDQGQRRCVQNVVDALARLDVRGLVTTGPALDPRELRGGDRVEIVRSAPHREVIDRADLVITHGGHGTVLKALVAGRPLVVLPHGRDQPGNAVRVSARGAGLVVRRTASASTIATAVTTVLSTRCYAEAARRLGRSIRAEIDRSPLVDELESL
ncbi:nucleotide disphospho-sugar-binding domain-containing protein [Pseudonocardia parietis]|uniref:MGT family glycosyltransferase n=1 Tax=Pseudonocardia parietis TaxID=570936 RepID=A0ABS4VSZ2_9PSEU|nr:nucleotide disphospho-sugar-binding domain-containing protein [Pseudonocardia parietis]MBP2367036.1 MGT family glycosyltransferase [Pseudonocardia parietis]